MTRRRRGLTGEERELWQTVARTAVPLRPAEAVPEPVPAAAPEEPQVAAAEADRPRRSSGSPSRPPAAPPRAHPPLHPIEKRTISRLARGSIEIDARIDLHGMTQLAAHERLHRFLRDAQAGGARVVLVITGKGRPGDDGAGTASERGVLRRRVPQWLAEPGIRSIVLGFDEARGHGGSGALYVRLRKARGK